MQGDRSAGTVRGLGVCDALRVELTVGQRAAVEPRLEGLWLQGSVLVGPADRVLAVVSACLAAAIEDLRSGLEGRAAGPLTLTPQLEAAQVWIATALDCAAVEGFSFAERR